MRPGESGQGPLPPAQLPGPGLSPLLSLSPRGFLFQPLFSLFSVFLSGPAFLSHLSLNTFSASAAPAPPPPRPSPPVSSFICCLLSSTLRAFVSRYPQTRACPHGFRVDRQHWDGTRHPSCPLLTYFHHL